MPQLVARVAFWKLEVLSFAVCGVSSLLGMRGSGSPTLCSLCFSTFTSSLHVHSANSHGTVIVFGPSSSHVKSTNSRGIRLVLVAIFVTVILLGLLCLLCVCKVSAVTEIRQVVVVVLGKCHWF